MRIADVDGARPVGPAEIGLDLDPKRGELRHPGVNLRRIRRETHMACAACAMGRHWKPRSGGGDFRFACVEQQEHAVTDAKEHMAVAHALNPLKAQNFSVKGLGGVQIAHVKGALKDFDGFLWCHSTVTPACYRSCEPSEDRGACQVADAIYSDLRAGADAPALVRIGPADFERLADRERKARTES